MAAMTTTYFEAGRSWGARVAERNAELLAQQALRRRGFTSPATSTTPAWSRRRTRSACARCASSARPSAYCSHW